MRIFHAPRKEIYKLRRICTHQTANDMPELEESYRLEHWCSDTDLETKPNWRIRKLYSLAPSRTSSGFRMCVRCNVRHPENALPLACTTHLWICSQVFYTESACFTRSARLNHGNHKYVHTWYIIDVTSHNWEPCSALYMFERVLLFGQTNRLRQFVVSLLPSVVVST
jgi:hypothetical protein